MSHETVSVVGPHVQVLKREDCEAAAVVVVTSSRDAVWSRSTLNALGRGGVKDGTPIIVLSPTESLDLLSDDRLKEMGLQRIPK